MLEPGLLNFNAGTTSPLTRPVFDAMRSLAERQARDPVEFIFRDIAPGIERSRQALAAWLHCDASNLVLVGNATYAVNTLARAITWQPGDEVLLTDQEYAHFQALWRRIAREYGVKLVTVTLPVAPAPFTTEELLALFAAAKTPRTRLLFVSHVSYKTGMALPVRELAAFARQAGIMSVVDGAHAPGMVPVDVAAIDADVYVGVLHKWMMAPVGASFLVVRRDLHASVPPLQTTSTSEYDPEAREAPVSPDGPTAWIASHEYQGTRDRIPQLVIPDAIAVRETVGDDAAQARMRHLARQLRPRLLELGFTCISQDDPAAMTGMVTYLPPARAGALHGDRLWRGLRADHAVELAVSPWASPGGVMMRVSTAWFNGEDEVDALVATLKDLDWSKYR